MITYPEDVLNIRNWIEHKISVFFRWSFWNKGAVWFHILLQIDKSFESGWQLISKFFSSIIISLTLYSSIGRPVLSLYIFRSVSNASSFLPCVNVNFGDSGKKVKHKPLIKLKDPQDSTNNLQGLYSTFKKSIIKIHSWLMISIAISGRHIEQTPKTNAAVNIGIVST